MVNLFYVRQYFYLSVVQYDNINIIFVLQNVKKISKKVNGRNNLCIIHIEVVLIIFKRFEDRRNNCLLAQERNNIGLQVNAAGQEVPAELGLCAGI
jgi:hypothetical protein